MEETNLDKKWKLSFVYELMEEICNFLHRIKKTVDKGWPNDMAGVVAAEQAAERTAQARQRRQR